MNLCQLLSTSTPGAHGLDPLLGPAVQGSNLMFGGARIVFQSEVEVHAVWSQFLQDSASCLFLGSSQKARRKASTSSRWWSAS